MAAYQRIMSDLVTGPGIDLIHLGMGPDGHTASLFPGDAEPRGRTRASWCAATEDPNGRNPHPRLTLTLPAINSARLAVFTVAGDVQGGRRGRAAPRRRPPGRPGPRRAHAVAGGRRRARRRPLDWPRCSPTPISSAPPWPS